MIKKVKNIWFVLFSIIFIFCTFSFTMINRNFIANAEMNYLFKNDGTFQATVAKPTAYGTHITSNNPTGVNPAYQTNEKGTSGTVNIDNGNLWLVSLGVSTDARLTRAVNITLPKSLDTTYVKTLTLKFEANLYGGRTALLQKDFEWFTLYGVNEDGSIANDGVGFEFTNENVTGNGNMVIALEYDEFKCLADDNGVIHTLQWNYWNDTTAEGESVIFVMQSIEYELYQDSECKTLTFKDVNGTDDLKTALIGNNVPSEIFDEVMTSVTGYKVGLKVVWKDSNGKVFDSKSTVTEDTVLYPTLIKDSEYYTKYLYSGDSSMVSFSEPTSYINSAVEGENEALINDGEFWVLYSSEDDYIQLNCYAKYHHGAVDVQFTNPITDISKVKKLTLKISVDIETHNGKLIYDADGLIPYYRLYGFNGDGTVRKNAFLDFNNDNVTSFNNITVEFNSSELMSVATEDGRIEKLQWNCYNTEWITKTHYKFTIYSISYEEFSPEEYYNVEIFDVDKTTLIDTLSTPYNLIFAKKELPDASVTGYPKQGYTLKYKTFGGDVYFDESTVLEEDMAIYACYEANEYLLNYVPDNGDVIEGNIYSFGMSISKPVDPLKAGYSFGGWYEEGSKTEFDFSSMPDRDVSLCAKWIPNVKSITVVQLSNGIAKVLTAAEDCVVGATIEIEVLPDMGYSVKDIYGVVYNDNKISFNKVSDSKYSFVLYDYDVVIEVSFEKKAIVLEPKSFEGGVIGFEQESYEIGDTVKVTIQRMKDFDIKSLKVNGVELDVSGDNISFVLTEEIVNIVAEFKNINGGCSGNLGNSSVYIVLVVLVGLGVLFRRRKDND